MNYDFNLLSGNYKTTYKLQDGPNPENSTVTTPYYTDHFSDRWLNDQLKVTTAGSSGVDILDRAKAQFAPGNCGRSEDTFNDAEGAFIANKSGPVRAIRSYIGANSGPLTQREHIFYEQPRGHPHVPAGARDPGRHGLLRLRARGERDDLQEQPEHGRRDDRRRPRAPPPTPGALTWESVDGGQGGLSIVHTNQTDIAGFASSSYYFDDSTPGIGRRAPVHGRLDGLRQQRALDHAEHPEHRSAHRRRSTACSPPAPSTSRTPARPTARLAPRSWPSPIGVSADELPVGPVRRRRWRAPRRRPERPLDHTRAHARAREDDRDQLAPARPEAVHRLVVRAEHESRKAAPSAAGLSASSTISWAPGACFRNSSSNASLNA